MSVAISWANKMQLAKCDIMVGFPISSHIYGIYVYTIYLNKLRNISDVLNLVFLHNCRFSVHKLASNCTKYTLIVQLPIFW